MPLVIGIGVAGVLAGSFWFGYQAGQDAVEAERFRLDEAVRLTREEAKKGTADAIAGLRPQIQVINQKVRETVRVEPVYRECVHPPGVLGDINRALVGPGPAGGGSVPRPDPSQ